MTYNILNGGIDTNGSRIEKIIDTINKISPDFVAFQEANEFDKNNSGLLKRVSTETNLPYYALSEGAPYENSSPYSVACISRYPLQKVYPFPNFLFRQAVLSVIVDSPLGELSLCNVHLHSTLENERVREAKIILDYQSKFEKSILLGDFNALSSSDKYDDLSMEEFTHHELNRFDLTDLLKKTHIDVATHLNANDMRTYPTNGVPHPVSKIPIRIDYMFVTPSLVKNIKRISVIKTSSAKKASDHYPITLTLE